MTNNEKTPRQVTHDQLVALLKQALLNNGYSERSAGTLAANCAAAQRDGSVSHGIFRLKDYAATIKSGYVNGDPVPSIEDVAPGFLRADADNGFAQIALSAAADAIGKKARQNGIAVLAIRNSHHLGALYLDVEDFARQGFIAFAVVNSIGVVAPPGGHRGVYGTNPMAFAAPRASGEPIVFDQASSIMAHGDVQVAARRGHSLPENAGIDRHGRLTSSPQAILDDGAINTFGGHKGASIALMVELLCAGLVGADFSFEVNWANNPGAKTARTGETIILIHPGAGAANLPSFAARTDVLVRALADAGQSRIPGDRRLLERQSNNGQITLSADDWSTIETFSRRDSIQI